MKTKQQEIEDGLQGWIDKYGYSLRPKDLMAWLDSQGVMIKAERELPKLPVDLNPRLIRITDIMSPAYASVQEAYLLALQDMGEAGYVAAEPLVGGK